MLHAGGESVEISVKKGEWNSGSRLKVREREGVERCGASCCRGGMPKKSNKELSVETSESRGTG